MELAKTRTPEMEACVTKSRELFRIYWNNKTPEALESFKQAERERYKQHYKENPEKERQRVKEWHQKQNKIFDKCEICGVEMKKPSMKQH